MVRGLREDDAQSFIDVVDEVRSVPVHHTELRFVDIDVSVFSLPGTTGHARSFATDPKEVSQIVVPDVWTSRTCSNHHEDPR